MKKRKHRAATDPFARTLAHPVARAMLRTKTVDDHASEHQRLLIIEGAAINQFQAGKPTTQDFAHLYAMWDISRLLAAEQIGAEAGPVLDEAKAALVEIDQNFRATGTLRATHEQIATFRDLWAVAEGQRRLVNLDHFHKVVKRAVLEVQNASSGT